MRNFSQVWSAVFDALITEAADPPNRPDPLKSEPVGISRRQQARTSEQS